MATIDLKELEEFNEMVDNIIDDIENGKVKSNPLAPEAVDIADADASNIVVAETATEMGEESLMTESDEDMADVMGYNEATESGDDEVVIGGITVNGKSFAYAEDEEDVIGNPSKSLVVISNDGGEVIFGNAAVAERETGFHQTTVRNRCSKDYVDADNNVWSYRQND